MEDAKTIYRFFWISVLLKGGISALEIVAGLVTLFISPAAITSFVTFLTQGELAEDPNDFIATHLVHAAQSFSAPLQTFVAIYLLSRGIIKLLLVIALLKNKLWAYPVSLVVLSIFVIYQTYQVSAEHSLVVAAITAFDLVVMYFIWREYKLVTGAHPQEHQ